MDIPQLVDYFITQGPWAVTFICLLVYVMRTNKEREERQERTNSEREGKLHDLLSKFTEKYDVIVEEIRELSDKFNGKDK